MRTATIYNFLLEANLMASAAILLMIVFRQFLRKPLGNRLIYFLWLLIAIRLLCPLAIANPLMNEFRPTFLADQGIRPIAGQIKIRLTDAAYEVRDMTSANSDSLVFQGARGFTDGMYYATLSRLLLRVYLYGAGIVLLLFVFANVRFRRKLKSGRVEEISGKLLEQYYKVCKERGVKPLPVWFVDPLPSACLVGVMRPYIALPLTATPQEAIHVLTHEVCHYKGKDHWVSLLRLICCVVHWFNPLVWLAAYMSRSDGELACDSRVVQKLSRQERKNYTNTLVLSATRRYAPGVGVLATGMTMTGRKLQNRVRSILRFERTVKWLVTTMAVFAAMLLVMSFFTAEHYTYPQMSEINANSNLLTPQPLQNKEEAQRFAENFLMESSLALDVAGAEWMVNDMDTAYEIQVQTDADERPIDMTILKNGFITDLYIPSDFNLAGAIAGMYSVNPDAQNAVAAYIKRFLEINIPFVVQPDDQLDFGGEGVCGDQRFVTYYGLDKGNSAAYWVSMQVELLL